ncbi:BMP family ABC transporter substrate-binding protein [Rhizobium rhizogenes]|uniref:BMP family ABC transporter substrate-binding protein n=1 Tax=Rhizobium rhizogenes TaxID=359 RepID=UPI00226F567D|nr:BMP family ABC transporter substrate-binding protein [Rhizobium rhizogenes]
MRTEKSNIDKGNVSMHRLKTAAIALIALGAAHHTEAQQAPRIVLVSPNQIGVNDYLKLAAAGSEAVAKEHGGTAKLFESLDPITRKRDLDAAARDGADYVLSVGFEFADLLDPIAEAHPNTTFLAIDYCPQKPGPNVHCLFVREQEMAFLSGAEAAWLKSSGTFATIGGIDIPLLHRYTDGFLDGVKYADPSASLKPQQWIGGSNPFSDPARASQMASALYFDGVDTILVAAGASGGGVVSAARSMPGKFVVGADTNNCPLAPTAVIDNVEKRMDRLIKIGLDMAIEKKLPGTISLGLKEGVVTLTSLESAADVNKCVASKNTEVLEKVKALRQDVIDGKVPIKDPMNP